MKDMRCPAKRRKRISTLSFVDENSKYSRARFLTNKEFVLWKNLLAYLLVPQIILGHNITDTNCLISGKTNMDN